MTTDEMRFIEVIMQFHDVKIGDAWTARQVEAIDHLYGDLYKKLGPLREIKIHFDSSGMPHTLDTDIIESCTIDGVEVDLKNKKA